MHSFFKDMIEHSGSDTDDPAEAPSVNFQQYIEHFRDDFPTEDSFQVALCLARMADRNPKRTVTIKGICVELETDDECFARDELSHARIALRRMGLELSVTRSTFARASRALKLDCYRLRKLSDFSEKRQERGFHEEVGGVKDVPRKVPRRTRRNAEPSVRKQAPIAVIGQVRREFQTVSQEDAMTPKQKKAVAQVPEVSCIERDVKTLEDFFARNLSIRTKRQMYQIAERKGHDAFVGEEVMIVPVDDLLLFPLIQRYAKELRQDQVVCQLERDQKKGSYTKIKRDALYTLVEGERREYSFEEEIGITVDVEDEEYRRAAEYIAEVIQRKCSALGEKSDGITVLLERQEDSKKCCHFAVSSDVADFAERFVDAMPVFEVILRRVLRKEHVAVALDSLE